MIDEHKRLHPKWEDIVELAHRRYGAYPVYHDEDYLTLQFTPSFTHQNEMNSFLMVIPNMRRIVYTDKRQVTLRAD